MTSKVDEILGSKLSNDLKFKEIQDLINKTKNKLEVEVLLGEIDVNQLFN